MGKLETEVLIIGGGCVGTAAARELSKYKVDVTLVEKNVDVGQGVSKYNANLVCQGSNTLFYRVDTKIGRLCFQSMLMMEPLCKELDVPFKRGGGGLFLIKNQEEMAVRKMMKRRIDENIATGWMPDVGIHLIDRETLYRMEPNLSKGWIGAMYDPFLALSDSVRMCMAVAENAKQNGVNVMVETEVLAISPGANEFTVETSNGTIKCRFIVNAAGEYAQAVARLADADDFAIYPVQLFQGVLDRKVRELLNYQHFSLQGMPVDFSYIIPSVHDSIFFGTVSRLGKIGDHHTTKWQFEEALRQLQNVLPFVERRDIINFYGGYHMSLDIETPGWLECWIEVAKRVPRFINAQVQYPGCNAAPAICKEVVRLLAGEGLKLEENPNFNPYRKAIPIFRELSDGERQQLIAQDLRYGHLVCRCETVTEGEIVEAIKRGAKTLDGVKFRCRPGMGRCHGGFCSPRVMKILARELNILEEEVTKKGPQSQHLLFKSKELLGKGGKGS